MNYRGRQFLFALAILLVCSVGAAADVWYVNAANTGGAQTGTTWATAFTKVQEGIDAAFSDGGGEVWVAQGTYGEARISFPHGFDAGNTGSIILKEGVDLYGGFAGTETQLSQRDPATRVTTLDGSTARGGQPAYHVVAVVDVQNKVTLDGFTISGGEVPESYVGSAGTGGGAGIFSYYSTLKIKDSIFRVNTVQYGSGGALSAYASNTIVDGCLFQGNFAGSGGGIAAGGGLQYTGGETITGGEGLTVKSSRFIGNYSRYGAGAIALGEINTIIENCLFEGNGSESVDDTQIVGGIDGAAIYATTNFEASHTNISGCRFKGNQCGGYGGAIYVERGSVLTVDSTVFESNLARQGGGIYLDSGGQAAFQNCVFRENRAYLESGGAVWTDFTGADFDHCTFFANTAGSQGTGGGISGGDSVSIRNSILWGNSPNQVSFSGSVTYSCIQGGFPGAGNISSDPAFVDAANGDFRLQSNSPCIDTGDPQSENIPDFNGVWRPQGPLVDMGAFEFVDPSAALVTLAVSGKGAFVPAGGTQPVQAGTVLPIEVIPEIGWRLLRWEGALSGNTNPTTLQVTGTTTLTAVLAQNPAAALAGQVLNWRTGEAVTTAQLVLSEGVFPGRELLTTQPQPDGTFSLNAYGDFPMTLAASAATFVPITLSPVFAPSNQQIRLEPLTPIPASGVKARAGAEGVRVTWSPSPSPDTFGYLIYRGTSTNFNAATLLTPTNPVTTLLYQDRTPGTGTFYYWVEPLNNDLLKGLPAGPAAAAKGVVSVRLGDAAGVPGDTLRIPIAFDNAYGISPTGLDINIQYPAHLADPARPVSVERTSLSASLPFEASTSEPGRARISGLSTPGNTALAGEGNLFDLVIPLRADIAGVQCGVVRFQDFTAGGGPSQPGVQLLDFEGNLIPAEYSGIGSLCVLGPELEPEGEGEPEGTPEGEPQGCAAVLQGDVNGDGLINSGDVIAALRHAVALTLVDDTCRFTAGDLNADGDLNSGDAILLLRKAVGLPLNPPAGKSSVAKGGAITVSLGQATVAPGGWAEIPVTVSGAEGVGGIEFAVSYPPALSFVSVESAAAVGEFTSQANGAGGFLRVAMSSRIPADFADTRVATLRFLVEPNASSGAYPLKLSQTELKGDFGESFRWTRTLVAASGSVTVLGTPTDVFTAEIRVSGQGTTDPAPGVYDDLPRGYSEPVTAIPAPGWRFVEWRVNDAPFGGNPVTGTVNSNLLLLAVFESEVEPALEVFPGEKRVSADAGSTLFEVFASGTPTNAWSSQVIEGGFLTIDEGVTGSGRGRLALAYTENTTGSPRTGKVLVRLSNTTLLAQVEIEQSAEGGPGEPRPVHSADIDSSAALELSELMRVVQFYNSDGIQCAEETTEDQYDLGVGPDESCPRHTSDYLPPPWTISLSELLRGIQIFNLGGYTFCAEDSDDGYCPPESR